MEHDPGLSSLLILEAGAVPSVFLPAGDKAGALLRPPPSYLRGYPKSGLVTALAMLASTAMIFFIVRCALRISRSEITGSRFLAGKVWGAAIQISSAAQLLATWRSSHTEFLLNCSVSHCY